MTTALRSLRHGTPFVAASDLTVTPTYVPDLVGATLDLLIDRESGLWHLANATPLTWEELAREAAGRAGLDPQAIQGMPSSRLGLRAARPVNSALMSERGPQLPPLSDALERYLREVTWISPA